MAKPDFPRSLPEFMRRFRDEEACFSYLLESRWAGGRFSCPGCGHGAAYRRKRRFLLECAKCRRLTSATAGTVMHGSRQPLASWLLAAYLLVADKRGISAAQLQRTLGLHRHEVAYQMLHKLRAAMVAPGRERLRGRIELDETFLGAPKPGPAGRGALGKLYVLGAVEVREGKPSRIRLRHIAEIANFQVLRFLHDNVERGSTLLTDGASVYRPLKAEGWSHRIVRAKPEGGSGEEGLPMFHMAVSNLKRWLLGTFHGSVRADHLQAYLNEFAFRFNRRGNLQAAFQTLLGIAPQVTGPTYAGLYTGAFVHPNSGRG